ncbi:MULTISPECIES: polyribonucleotide nucleotidyltransferase [Turicibacter]|uniref:Polyribonucleotide nucleotidyltransferase n=9 Tax=Turicibacter sanguinis TaxID=154288 RepID=A0ABP2I5C8_9FIRM|nr:MULTISPECIES: polyribonucleotide nucleotidyltransferase [Turicibacter]EFF65052.1 polyribonucleotide nucleotidyltransferase [Turicibacter sanguinis PC909]EGC90774.1 polyribonucleotide nucleotidyltransferase [Turicibacter sp. HGF1]MBP3903641.1 polyribonucleotide nucleotidyltransferase [Turicibacter sp.]MCU7191610.1 polyribonucleotide nucleotidyltransferase [Turicibacter sanguinis]MCU7201965.1 polyribonucleotide nucleotidyltransferase [Turicibacter sanguinis]
MSEKHVYSFELAGRPLSFEIGELAKQANASVLVRYGDTVVLSTCVASKEPKDIDFFPLTIGYEERLYAVGKVPGGFIKREGRPSEHAVLSGRLIDRPIRPLFPDGFRNDVQVINYVMSVDHDNSPAIAAMIGSSLSLSISDIPFEGPIAGVVVGRVDGKFIINPTVEELEKSDIDLTVAGTKDAINMVEAGAKEVPEEDMLEAIMFGHEMIKQIVAFQEQIVAEIGQPKMDLNLYEVDATINARVREMAEADMLAAIQVVEKHARQEAIDAVNARVLDVFESEEASDKELKQVKEVLNKIVKEEVRRLITDEKVRPDGRKIDEIRPLSSRVDLLPRTHGSALFTRGQTQALSVCTLGALNEHQMLDGLEVEETKRFMHHYNFPPFSVGETGRYGAPGRREIGHGALGERALKQVMPSEKDFPYTVRLVSEVLESNGSTSQASICASTMALMAAGVPIKAPVAGIAMGLVKKGENYTVLTDIQGMEDHLGDMDFKVAGTAKGVTALQMDIKIEGLNRQILEEALQQAKVGRMQILNHMLGTISETREELSAFAPKIKVITIKVDKIRDVIGPGGKQINEIIDKTGVKIDIEQDGTVYILHDNSQNINQAVAMIEDIVREVEVGKIYLGKVVRIEKFGAFVEIFPGQDGLVHISQLAEERVAKTEDVVAIGDEILVKVTEVDERGRVNLSRKEAMKEQAAEQA